MKKTINAVIAAIVFLVFLVIGITIASAQTPETPPTPQESIPRTTVTIPTPTTCPQGPSQVTTIYAVRFLLPADMSINRMAEMSINRMGVIFMASMVCDTDGNEMLNYMRVVTAPMADVVDFVWSDGTALSIAPVWMTDVQVIQQTGPDTP